MTKKRRFKKWVHDLLFMQVLSSMTLFIVYAIISDLSIKYGFYYDVKILSILNILIGVISFVLWGTDGR